MTVVMLDTHVLHWWSAEPDRVSKRATALISDADTLAVADITWFELAWLATHDRIRVRIPVRTWLDDLAARIRTVAITPGIAAAAVALPATFPGDPADRLIYATAGEIGAALVTKDRWLRSHAHPGVDAVW